MTVRELQQILAAVPEYEKDSIVILPSANAEMPGMYVFEGACPAVTEMVTLGPPPSWASEEEKALMPDNTRCFLIAPHSFHDEDAHDEVAKRALN